MKKKIVITSILLGLSIFSIQAQISISYRGHGSQIERGIIVYTEVTEGYVADLSPTSKTHDGFDIGVIDGNTLHIHLNTGNKVSSFKTKDLSMDPGSGTMTFTYTAKNGYNQETLYQGVLTESSFFIQYQEGENMVYTLYKFSNFWIEQQ